MKNKKVWGLVLAVVMLVGMLTVFPMSAHAAEIIASGSCGENVTWTLDDEGTLTISGTGEMKKTHYGMAEGWEWNDFLQDITAVVIEEGVTGLYGDTFAGCTNLVSVVIPEGVTIIPYAAFSGCANLETVTIPDSVTDIRTGAFDNCNHIKEIILSENAHYRYCDGILYDNPVTKIVQVFSSAPENLVILEGVTEFAASQFMRLASLKELEIPGSVVYVYNCGHLETLEKVILNEGTETIGACAFAESTLTDILIPTSVTLVEDSAFLSCDNLQDVWYMGTEEQWETIVIESRNDALLHARIHFMSTGIGMEADNEDNSNENQPGNNTPNQDTEGTLPENSTPDKQDQEESKGGNAAVWILIIVLLVAVIAVLAVIVLKKKKQ